VKTLSRVAAFFPAGHAAMVLACCGMSVYQAERPLVALLWVGAALALLYLLPPLLFRCHNRLFPLREGMSLITGDAYSPWWAGHQLQALYISLPPLEAALRLVPGLYSAWLRLWGARIGRDVYWTPRVEILDRSLIDVGDHVVFGHCAVLCSHVVFRRDEELRLYVRRIRIGANCLVGADTHLGPGTVTEPHLSLPYGTRAPINQKFTATVVGNQTPRADGATQVEAAL